ncbi:MAG TPA: hypothetical protein VFG12_06055 [Rhodopila sp.]|nr:hypothetical protein [Rhodopila sp.]
MIHQVSLRAIEGIQVPWASPDVGCAPRSSRASRIEPAHPAWKNKPPAAPPQLPRHDPAPRHVLTINQIGAVLKGPR